LSDSKLVNIKNTVILKTNVRAKTRVQLTPKRRENQAALTLTLLEAMLTMARDISQERT